MVSREAIQRHDTESKSSDPYRGLSDALCVPERIRERLRHSGGRQRSDNGAPNSTSAAGLRSTGITVVWRNRRAPEGSAAMQPQLTRQRTLSAGHRGRFGQQQHLRAEVEHVRELIQNRSGVGHS